MVQLTIDWIFEQWLKATTAICETKKELTDLTNELTALDERLQAAKELKYETIESPNGGDPTIRSLISLQKEFVDLEAQSFQANGGTKDERAAALMRHVRAENPIYDIWTRRIEESDRLQQQYESQMKMNERQVTTVQKRLWAEQEILHGLNKFISYCTAQTEAESCVSVQKLIQATEQRLQIEIELIRKDLRNKR